MQAQRGQQNADMLAHMIQFEKKAYQSIRLVWTFMKNGDPMPSEYDLTRAWWGDPSTCQRSPQSSDYAQFQFPRAEICVVRTSPPGDTWQPQNLCFEFWQTQTQNTGTWGAYVIPRERQTWRWNRPNDYSKADQTRKDQCKSEGQPEPVLWVCPIAEVFCKDAHEAGAYDAAFRHGAECLLNLMGAECGCTHSTHPLRHTYGKGDLALTWRP